MEKNKGELVVFSLSYMQIIVISLAVVLAVTFSFLLGLNIGKHKAEAIQEQTSAPAAEPSACCTTTTPPEAATGLEAAQPMTITSLPEEKTSVTFTPAQPEKETVKETEQAPKKTEKRSHHEEKSTEKKAKHKEEKAEKPAHKSSKTTSGKHEKFVLQVASLGSKEAAAKLSKELADKGYFTYVEEAKIKGKGVFYRVNVGGFAAKDEAEAARRQLRAKQHVESIIITR